MKHIHKAAIVVTFLLGIFLLLQAVITGSPPPSVEEMWQEYESVERLYWLW